MGRTTLEHERAIDVLDDLVTFGYAYEGERAANDDLDRLRMLASDVRHEVEQWMRGADSLEVDAAVIRVLNGLQDAVRADAPPKELDFSQWTNKPQAFSRQRLVSIMAEQAKDLFALAMTVADRLHTSFPPEAKRFISREQVSAVVRAALTLMPDSFTVPIHVDLLSRLLHHGFHEALGCGAELSDDMGRCRSLMHEYIRRAAPKLEETVLAADITAMIRQLFQRAKANRVALGEFYPWGALWRDPVQDSDWLGLYARLNLSGAVVDKKFRRQTSKTTNVGGPVEEFIQWGARNVPRVREGSSRPEYQTYFNTDDAEIQIDGAAIQKRALMVIRFDEPLADVERNLWHYGMYLLAQRRKHCTYGRTRLSAAENALARKIASQVGGQRKPRRAVLHDMSSVLGHLCALIFLRMQRDPERAGMASKVLILEIHQLVQDAGFKYGVEAIRKACQRRHSEIAAVQSYLAKG